MLDRYLTIAAAGSLILLVPGLANAQPEPTDSELPDVDPGTSSDDAGSDRSDQPRARRPAEPNFAWKPPADALETSNRVSLGGYVEGVFAGPSSDWTSPDPVQLGPPGQLLVPASDRSGFQFDGALVLRANPHERASALIELHLVSDPSGEGAAGPGGLTLALTEAAASWKLFDEVLTISAGLFWAPFGTVNKDWLGGTGLFVLIPRASGAFPTHYNERGVRINGSKAFDTYFGVNYVVSAGNGLGRFNIVGQTSADLDSNRTVIGRFGVFSGLGEELQIGYSAGVGELRNEVDPTADVTNPLRYEADMVVHGVDLSWTIQEFDLRTYYIYSKEALVDPLMDPANLTRHGFMFEASYRVRVNGWKALGAVVPKGRFDLAVTDQLGADPTLVDNLQSAVYSVGLDFRVGESLGTVLSLEYHIQDELKGQSELDNNRFVGRLLTTF